MLHYIENTTFYQSLLTGRQTDKQTVTRCYHRHLASLGRYTEVIAEVNSRSLYEYQQNSSKACGTGWLRALLHGNGHLVRYHCVLNNCVLGLTITAVCQFDTT